MAVNYSNKKVKENTLLTSLQCCLPVKKSPFPKSLWITEIKQNIMIVCTALTSLEMVSLPCCNKA
jgi:hypothetical protein